MNYIFFGLFLLSKPSLLIPLLKGVYLPQYVQFTWLRKFKINTFIDIGANNGDVSKVIHHLFPKTIIYAFEPLKHKKNLIKSKIKSKKIFIATLAISDHTGKQIFHEYDYLPASSFLKPNPERKTFTKNVSKSYPVYTTTLDKYFFKKILKKPIAIKMDTQGTEELIIKGGKKILKQVSLIVVEASFIQTYKNQCLFDKIYKDLTMLGFVYKGGMLDSHFYPMFGPMVQENAVFVRKGHFSNYLLKEGA